jgi:enoyl-CoA hydratase/carnithine racemase
MTTFDDYKDRYETLALERTDSGVLTVRMHTGGGPHTHNGLAHREFPDAFRSIGLDPENEVVILTGTGGTWIADIDFSDVGNISEPERWYQILSEARHVLHNLADISVPVIAAVGGPAYVHAEYTQLADIVLASETAEFRDDQHLPVGVMPADGVQVVWPEVMGPTRARYFLLTQQTIGAEEALSLGMVNEVVPPERLPDRARELAEQLLEVPPLTRRYTRLMFAKKWKRLINDNVPFDMAAEGITVYEQGVGRGG